MPSKHLADRFSGGASELVFWSFRYFLGRQTIATCCFAQELARNWNEIDERNRKLIQRELEEAFRHDDEIRAEPMQSCPDWKPLGADCDRQCWELVRKAYLATP